MMWRATSADKYRPIKMPKLMTTICGSWHCQLSIFDNIKNLDIRSSAPPSVRLTLSSKTCSASLAVRGCDHFSCRQARNRVSLNECRGAAKTPTVLRDLYIERAVSGKVVSMGNFHRAIVRDNAHDTLPSPGLMFPRGGGRPTARPGMHGSAAAPPLTPHCVSLRCCGKAIRRIKAIRKERAFESGFYADRVCVTGVAAQREFTSWHRVMPWAG